MNLTGRTVLITGGGSGIGAATATVAAELGARCVLLGPEPDPLEKVAGEVGGVAVVGDAAVASDVRAAIEAAHVTFGALDGLVCCAGGAVPGRLGELSDDAWASSLGISLTTAVVSARECLADLVPQRGAIVIVSSFAALQAPRGAAGYVTAKTALIGLTRSLATDYGPDVRVNAVCPTLTRTAMADRVMDRLAQRSDTDREGAYRLATAGTPLQRPAEPVEVARVIAFLLSEWASFMTGSHVLLDGGEAASVGTL